MSDFRRYQPRRTSSSSGGWGRWLIVLVVVVVLALIGKLIWGKKKTTSTVSNTANAGISLLTDNANTNTATATNASTTNSANTNSAPIAASGNWAGFSVSKCPAGISNFRTPKRVVLTLGLSAANDQVTQALAALKTAGVPADFFSAGSFATKNPGVLKTVTDAGYAVYSQSNDSTDLTTLSDPEVLSAISKAETAITTAAGTTPKPILRPPSGAYTTQTLKLLNQQGYCAVLWTVDAYDWQDGMTVATAQERVMTAVAKQTGGSIVALHAGYDVTPQLITALVTELKTQGYTLTTLAAALNP